MVAALLEACAFCDRPENRSLLAEMLAQTRYLKTPVECLKNSFTPGASAPISLDIFHRRQANDPTDEKAAWTIELLYELLEQHPPDICNPLRAPVLKNIFRRDLFERAKAIAALPDEAGTRPSALTGTLAYCHA